MPSHTSKHSTSESGRLSSSKIGKLRILPNSVNFFKYVHAFSRELEPASKLNERVRALESTTGLNSIPSHGEDRLIRVYDKLQSLGTFLSDKTETAPSTIETVQDVFLRALPDLAIMHVTKSRRDAEVENSLPKQTGSDNAHSEQLFGANAAPRSLSHDACTHSQLLFDPCYTRIPATAPWLNHDNTDNTTDNSKSTTDTIPDSRIVGQSVVHGNVYLYTRARGGLDTVSVLTALEHDFVAHLSTELDVPRSTTKIVSGSQRVRVVAYLCLGPNLATWQKFATNFLRPVFSEPVLASEIVAAAENLNVFDQSDHAFLQDIAQSSPRFEQRTLYITAAEHSVYTYITRRFSPRACLAFIHYLANEETYPANSWLDSASGVSEFGVLAPRLLSIAREQTLGPIAPSIVNVCVNMPNKKNSNSSSEVDTTLEEFAEKYGVFQPHTSSSSSFVSNNDGNPREPTASTVNDEMAARPGLYSGSGAIDISTTARQSYANGTFAIDGVQSTPGTAPTSSSVTIGTSTSNSNTKDIGSSQSRPDLDQILAKAGIRDSIAEHISDESFWSTLSDHARPSEPIVLPEPAILRPDNIAPFLFEPYGNRRSCVNGASCRGMIDFDKNHRVTLMEFLTPEQEQVFVENGALPRQEGPCILCARFIIQRLINEIRRNGHETRRAISPHCYVVDEPGGYAKTAIVQSQPEATDGNCWPQRKYNPSDYRPVTRSVTTVPGESAPVTVRGFVEEGCFFV